MLWTVAASFFAGDAAQSTWLDDFVVGTGDRFRKIGPQLDAQRGWHNRAARATSAAGWWRHWRQAGDALAGTDGLVTVFPQLALMAALRRAMSRRRVPMVAWCFNVGVFPTGAKARLSRLALRGIERIVVHSSAEVAIVRDWLDVGEGVVQFVPIHPPPIPRLEAEERAAPFVAAIGSANRDMATLMEAARRTGLPLVIVAAPRTVEGLDVPPNVTLRAGLTLEECRRVAQRARFSVVPLIDTEAASGQITLAEAMQMGRPVIATRSAGSIDYIEDGRTGVLVPPADAEALARAMRRLWDDGPERERLATAAAAFAEASLSDVAAARAFARILAEAREVRAGR